MSSVFNHGARGRVIFVLHSEACVSMHDFEIELKMSRLNGSVEKSAFSSKRFSFPTSLNRGSNRLTLMLIHMYGHHVTDGETRM